MILRINNRFNAIYPCPWCRFNPCLCYHKWATQISIQSAQNVILKCRYIVYQRRYIIATSASYYINA